MELSFDEAAARYLQLGWKVFPIARGDKVPAIKGGHGCKDATDDWATIQRWAEEYPGCNIGIATGEPSGVTVIDVDTSKGGMESAKRYRWPQAPLARTQSGGFHLFFRLEKGVKNSAGKLGKGVDVRGTGGYVVAAPSVYIDQQTGEIRPYQWIRPPRGAALPRLPDEVLKALEPKPKPIVKPTANAVLPDGLDAYGGALRYAERATEGGRNNSLFWTACRVAEGVRAGRVPEKQAIERLREVGLTAGLPDWEIDKTLRSAFERAE